MTHPHRVARAARRIEVPATLAVFVTAAALAAGCAPPPPPADDAAATDATLADAAAGDDATARDGCTPVIEPDGAVSSLLCRIDANCFEMVLPDGAARPIC